MDLGRMYISRTLPSTVNEFDSSDWLIRIYHGVDSIILVRSQEGYTSQLLLTINQDKCQTQLPCLLSKYPFLIALQMLTSEYFSIVFYMKSYCVHTYEIHMY